MKGVVARPSDYNVKETIDRLVIFLQQQEITVYARINRQIEVRRFGQNIRPLEFILFGNPRTSGPVIDRNPLSAMDLPLRIIAWEDEEKKCWVAYKDPAFLKEIHNLRDDDMVGLDLENVISKALSF